MRTQTQDAPRSRRTVSGITGSATPPAGGPGWTAQRTGVGVYQIRFVPPFRAPPDITIMAVSGSAALATAANTTADSFNMNTFGAGGAAGDAYVYFNAQGLA